MQRNIVCNAASSGGRQATRRYWMYNHGMRREEIEQTVRLALADTASNVDAGSIDPDRSFRD